MARADIRFALSLRRSWNCTSLIKGSWARRLTLPGTNTMNDDTEDFALLLGHAVLETWGDLPRHVQEKLFETAVPRDEITRYGLAVYLHDHHPRTAHPPRPEKQA